MNPEHIQRNSDPAVPPGIGSSVFKEQPVALGIANNDYAIVEDGLEEGEEIALCDPFETQTSEE